MESNEINERIIKEAADLFRIYGTKAVTMDFLAQQLGISKRTIYEKFRDKDELVASVLTWMFQRQKEMMEKMFSSEQNVFIAFFKHNRLMKEYFGSVNPIFKSDLKKFHNEVILKVRTSCGGQYENTVKFIEKGIEQGVIRNDIDPDIVNRCIQGMSRVVNDPEIFPPEHYRMNDVLRNGLINYLRGIATEEGKGIIAEHEKDFE